MFDFVARQKVGGTHLTYGYLKQFPALPPSLYTPAALDFIVPRVLELTYTAHDLEPVESQQNLTPGCHSNLTPPWSQCLGY